MDLHLLLLIFVVVLTHDNMNKYYQLLQKVLVSGRKQTNKKGTIRYLLNEKLTLSPADLLDIFEGHPIARKKLKSELQAALHERRAQRR